MDPQKAMRLGAWLAIYGTGNLEYITSAGEVVLHFIKVLPSLAIIDPIYNQALKAMDDALASIGIVARWTGYTTFELADKEGRTFRP